MALGHRRGVGKDTFARAFRETLLQATGLHAEIISFAAPLKEIGYRLYAWAGLQPAAYYETPEGRIAKETVLPRVGLSPRDIYISLGMKVREIYKETWVQLALHKCGETDIAIIPDLRFPNEVAAIRESGMASVLARVERPGIEQFSDPADSALAEFTDWDRVILNAGDETELRRTAFYLIDECNWGR